MKWKYIFIVFCLVFSNLLYAQENYTIVYGYSSLTFANQIPLRPNDFDRKDILYINGDSLSFLSVSGQRPKKKRNEVGRQRDQHSSYYFPKLNRSLEESFYAEPSGLLEYKKKNFDWVLHSDTMTIAGYFCQSAVVDGMKAWYAPSLPASFGHGYLVGLPGTILMLESRGERAYFLKALSVKKGAPHIVLPKAKIIPIKDGESKIEEMKKYFKD
ncbi:MAG: GLPGLI family protein [Bacteroidetes bacterium]|nr:GLPGLI family protein [Bacteroidota bacterium]